jgi:hypothetical protein
MGAHLRQTFESLRPEHLVPGWVTVLSQVPFALCRSRLLPSRLVSYVQQPCMPEDSGDSVGLCKPSHGYDFVDDFWGGIHVVSSVESTYPWWKSRGCLRRAQLWPVGADRPGEGPHGHHKR